jgi:NAD-dependent SIR2 family protein deacetylase
MRANDSKATKTRRGSRPPIASKVVFLTGAGASVPLGLPDTKGFLETFFHRDARELQAKSPDP